VADTIVNNIKRDSNKSGDNLKFLTYLFQNFKYPFPNIQWHYTSTYEIQNIIKSLKTKNSYGFDEISVKILKPSLPFIVSPLTYICNKSLSLGVFPDRLKYSIVKPIYKNGDKLMMSNYRAISLLTFLQGLGETYIYQII
jgi:hypothetical protein